MQAFASRVDVPEEHVKYHSAWPSLQNASTAGSTHQTVRIQSGKEKPASAFASVRYRDYWFWIENGDLQSKRALSVVMFFFTLADAGGSEKLPMVTIPAQ
jgi:hypothetical protein